MALIEKLNAIGDAIREKTGGTEKLTLDQMPTEIKSIETTSAGEVPSSALKITGTCQYRFAYGGWDWFLKQYGNQITTENVVWPASMFRCCGNLTDIPFDINLRKYQSSVVVTGLGDGSDMFYQCYNLTTLPKIIGDVCNIEGMFDSCYNLREIPTEFYEDINFRTINSSVISCSYLFKNCYSLRKIPMEILNATHSVSSNGYLGYYNNLFHNCASLNQISDLPVQTTGSASLFGYMATNCYRLRGITFAKQTNGTPYTANWSGVVLNLSNYVGYADSSKTQYITDYNSGITTSKKVTDRITYNNLSSDADWWTTDVAYSRYNKTSAIATINSLPDTSDYAATANTIKFKGDSGSLTNDGAINTMTANQIAVATAKGWTVSFV